MTTNERKEYAEMLDAKATAERDILAARIHSGKRVLPSEWARVGKLQLEAEDAWNAIDYYWSDWFNRYVTI